MARALNDDGSVARLAARLEAGTPVIVAALLDGTVLCSGRHQPVGTVSEIAGVGTPPTARRRVLALMVTT